MGKSNKRHYARAKTAGTIIMMIASLILPLLKSFLFPVSIIGVGIAVLLFISEFSKESLWKSFVIPAIVMTLCVVVSFIYQIYSKPKFATPDALIPSTLQNIDIRLSDLTREDFVIRNKTFDNCHIYGPAIIRLKDSTFVNSAVVMEGQSIESSLIVTTNTQVFGALLFKECVINNCTLYKISFIGTESQIAKIKAGIKK